jgi:hypothetical protein
MGSKLDYWFLLTKIAGGIGRDDFEFGIRVVLPVLDNLWWILCHVGGGIVLLPTFLNPSIFQSTISIRVWILDFRIHQKSIPIAQNSSNTPIFYLVNYYRGS